MDGCSKLFSYTVGVILLLAVASIVGVTVSQSHAPTITGGAQTLRQVDKGVQADSGRVQLSTPTPALPLPTPDWIAPSFAELCDRNARMTASQRRSYAQAMAGKRLIGWHGQVYAVERWDLQHYVVKVEMRGDHFFRARQVEIVGVNRELAALLTVGQQLLFDGTIRSIQTLGEQRCNPIYLVEATVIPQ